MGSLAFPSRVGRCITPRGRASIERSCISGEAFAEGRIHKSCDLDECETRGEKGDVYE